MFSRPTREEIRRFIDSQRRGPFSYSEVGATRSQPPAGFVVDHNRICVGRGEQAFERAARAIRCWKMFELGWVELCWPEAPIAEGTAVAVLVRHFGFWSLNAARIAYVVDDPPPVRRYGFAYGTLADHAERGEERFTVEWRRDDSVWYDLFAFSRPRHLLARIGYPLSRRLQQRFARDSLQTMLRAAKPQSEAPGRAGLSVGE